MEENDHFKIYSKAKTKAEDRYMVALFIKGLNNAKYNSKLKADLTNQCTWGSNQCPKTMTASYKVALHFKGGADDSRNISDHQINKSEPIRHDILSKR